MTNNDAAALRKLSDAATQGEVVGTIKALIQLAIDAGLPDDLLSQVMPDAKRKNGQPACDFAKRARRTINEARAILAKLENRDEQ
jgi:hypothetical protein